MCSKNKEYKNGNRQAGNLKIEETGQGRHPGFCSAFTFVNGQNRKILSKQRQHHNARHKEELNEIYE
jgi:hypothetical protein